MSFGKDNMGVIINEKRSVSLGTLGADTGLIIGTKLAILERFRMLKSEVIATVIGMTGSELGSLALYLVDGDYSLAEFEAVIEANGPLGPNDKVEDAIQERFVKFVGMTNGVINANGESLNLRGEGNQPQMVVIPRWTFARTKSWNWIAYNYGDAPTTGATLKIQTKCFGVWVT